MKERFLYHSFPRLHAGEREEILVPRGLAILSSLAATGFVFAPEIVTWRQKLADGSRALQFRQKRICFTELDPDDLPEHARFFGPFSLEFDIEVLRHLGALPVAYIPQTIEGANSASGVGATLVVQMFDAKSLLERLQFVKNAIAGDPNEQQITLSNEDWKTGTSDSEYKLPTKVLSDFINWLGYKNAPLPVLSNALHGMLSRMYPTDNERTDTALAYYQQREWRLIDDVAVGGVRQVRPLKADEKERLLAADKQFWEKGLVLERYGQSDYRFRRIDAATVLVTSGSGSPLELARSIIVPKPVMDEVKRLVGPTFARKVRSF